MSQRRVTGRPGAGSRGDGRGIGEAGDGRIRATVTGGRLESLRIDPALLRWPGETLIAHITEAVNTALADFRAGPHNSRGVPDFNLKEFADDLREKSEQFGLALRRAMAEAVELTDELRRSGVAVDDPPDVDFDDLADEVAAVLRQMGCGRADDEELVGVGEAPLGLVRAECAAGGRLVALDVDPRAMCGAAELEDHVVPAVNAALARLAESLCERRATSGLDPRALKAKLDDLRDRNLARLESYLAALGDVVDASVRPDTPERE